MTAPRTSLTLLVSSAGRRVELLQAFRAAAQDLGIALKVFASDLDPDMSAACRLADARFAVPRADSADYIPAMLAACEQHGIDLVVPTIDTELEALSEAVDRFAAIGTRIAVSAPDFVAMARDKAKTAEALAAAGLPTPRTASLAGVRADPAGWTFPVMVKPNHGSAGRSISVAQSPADLPTVEPEPLIVQELLVGAEYTINMFFDAAGTARCVIPHRRIRTRAGEVEKGVTERRTDLCTIGWQLAERFEGVRGTICFQAIVTERGPFVFEINARFGGGYPLAHEAGAQCAKWLLEEVAGLPSTAHDGWEEGVTMLRYDAAVFHRA